MASGKTTIGGIIAATLGWPLDDSDASIEARHGRTVRQLRESLGTEEMHALEARHLLDALGASRPRVVAPAASVIDVRACRTALTAPDVASLWLQAPATTLAERFSREAHRPSYGDDPAAFLEEQGRRRDPLFRSVHPIAIDVDTLPPEHAAATALRKLRMRLTLPPQPR